MKYLIFLSVLFFLFSCESTEKRQISIANDEYLYFTYNSKFGEMHLDKYCDRIKESKSFEMYSKKQFLKFNNNFGELCTSCCKFEDILILKKQSKTIYSP